AGAGSQDRVLVIGQASIGGSSLAIHSLSTPDQGSYTLLSTTGNVNGTFSTITGLPSGYSVIYQPNSVILQLTSSGFIMTTPGNLQVITGATLPFTVTVQNPAATGGASVNFTAASGMNTTGSVSPAVVVSAQSSAPATGLSFNATSLAPGPSQVGTFTGLNNGANAQQGSVTVDVLDHASFSTFTGGTLTLPNVREGYSGPQTSTNSLSVTNDPGFRVNLKGSAGGSIGNFSVSDVNAVAPGSSGSITASLTAGLTASSTPYSQNFTYQFADDSTLVGNNPNLAPTVTVTATVSVYNGQGVWGASPSGSWGTFSKWTLPGGYPGLDGAQSLKDTATIGSGLTGTLALDDGMGNPVVTQLNALNFNGTSGTVAPGAGGSITLRNDGGVPTPVAPTITVTGGTPTISAPIFLQNNTTITTTGANDQMTISGNITGTGTVGSTATGLTVTGLGTTTLSGTNTYPGKTTVNGGTLSVLSEASLGAVPGPTVPDQISISNGSTLAFTGNTTLATSQGITVGSGSNTLAVATSQTVVVSGQISGTASSTLIKTGTGTLDVRSNTGNGVLGGGTPGTLTLMAGTLAPNVGAPVAISMGNLNFNGGTLAIDVLGLAGQGNTNGNDYLNAEAVTFNKATPLTINLGMFVPTPGDQFTFLSDGTGLGATFNTDPQTHQTSYFTVNGNPAGPMQTFQVGTSFFQILYNQGALGGDMVLSTVVPVPEAGSAVLLLGGVGVVGLLRLRRRRNVPPAA
ncbi:MAG: autotransporter-associated beta strand repeat-containing protein, partial [Chthoniobacteraceae bacterium]